MDGFPFSLAFIVGHVEIDGLSFRIEIFNKRVFGQIQLSQYFGLNGQTGSVPLSDDRGKLVKVLQKRGFLAKVHGSGKDQGGLPKAERP